MPVSPTVSEQATKFILGLTTASWPPADYYVSLHTASPATTGTAEVVGGTYARQLVDWTWDAGDARGENDAIVEFTDMPSSTVTHAGVFDAASGGNYLFGGALTSSKTLTAGDAVRFNIGNLAFKVV